MPPASALAANMPHLWGLQYDQLWVGRSSERVWRRKGREAGSELLEGNRNSTQESKVKYEQKQSEIVRHIRKDGDTPGNQLLASGSGSMKDAIYRDRYNTRSRPTGVLDA